VEYDGRPVMKLSSAKVTAPGPKQVFPRPGFADVIGLADEQPPDDGRPLLETVMGNGQRTGRRPTLDECQERFAADLAGLPPQARRVRAPVAPRATLSARLSARVGRVRHRIDEEIPAPAAGSRRRERTTPTPDVQQQSPLSVSTSVYSKNPYWSQSTVTVTTKTKLSALKVVVRVNQTGGVESTGAWTSLGDKVTVHSAADSQSLDYVVTLNAGVTLNPGTYTFEAQYNHAEGTRGTGRDLYVVTATAPGSTGTETKQGHF
jgi:hypothetical protein